MQDDHPTEQAVGTAPDSVAIELADEMLDVLRRIGLTTRESVRTAQYVAGRIDAVRDEPAIAEAIAELSEVFEMSRD